MKFSQQYTIYPNCFSLLYWATWYPRGQWGGNDYLHWWRRGLCHHLPGKWDKAKAMISDTDVELAENQCWLDHKTLERWQGFLLDVTCMYPMMVLYLKGIHLTLDGRHKAGIQRVGKWWTKCCMMLGQKARIQGRTPRVQTVLKKVKGKTFCGRDPTKVASLVYEPGQGLLWVWRFIAGWIWIQFPDWGPHHLQAQAVVQWDLSENCLTTKSY